MRSGRVWVSLPTRLADIRARQAAGKLIGSRIIMAGMIEGESLHSVRSGIVVKDLQGARQAVDRYAQHGYRQIKIYNSFRPEWVAPTAQYAHSLGLRVSGHVPAFMRAEKFTKRLASSASPIHRGSL